MSEGAHWYYTILDYHVYFSDVLFYRYVDFLIQYPALFFLRNFGAMFSVGTASSIATYILSFGWTFHPIISLYITYRILRSYSRKDLFIFPVLSFLSAFMPASAYAVALALPAMSFFWPVFFCVFFFNGKNIKDFIITAMLLVGLAFCYEPTIIFFILFIMMALADLLWLKVKSKRYNLYLIFLCVLSIIFLLWVISTVPAKNTGPFWRSLLYGDWTTRLIGLVVTLSVSTILFFNFVAGRFKVVANSLAIIFFSLGTFYFFIRLDEIYSLDIFEYALSWAYDSRASALPLTWCVAAFCCLFSCFQRDDQWLHTKISQVAAVLVLITAFATAYVDFNQTREWNFYFGRFQQLVLQSEGCVHLSYKDFERDYKAPSVEAYSAGYSSVMAQIVNTKSDPLKSLVFTGLRTSTEPPTIPCPERKDSKVFRNEYGFSITLNGGRLVFSEEAFLKK